MTDVTPSLDDFRQSYETDNNAWWRLECGHHMNLFDAALEALDAAREAIDAMQTAHESQLTRMAKERARLERKVERLKAELEAAQRPPLGYVVVGRDPETGRMQTEGCIHEKRDAAEEWLRWVERYAVTGWRGEVGEVR